MTDYLTPTSTKEAIHLLETYAGEARIIAGGTDVMPDLRRQKIGPRCLIDITRIPGLDEITVTEDFVEVGAAVTFTAIKNAPFINRHIPALANAARSVGAPGIQNAATWVGNIVQAMPAADGAIVAIALEAEARILEARGAEWRPVESLFKGPGVSAVDPSRQLVTHLRFPHPRLPWGTAWQRVGRRPSLVLPILNCAVKLCLSPERRAGDHPRHIEHATIALGPVAPRPFRARKAEAFLRGRPPTAEIFIQAGHIAQQESTPRSSPMRASREYRLSIIPPLITDALTLAGERAAPENRKAINQS